MQGSHPDLDVISDEGCDAILSTLRVEPPNTVTILVLGPRSYGYPHTACPILIGCINA